MRSFKNRSGTGPCDRTPASVGRQKPAPKLLLSAASHHRTQDTSPGVGIAVFVLGVNRNEGPREVGAGRFVAARSLTDCRRSRLGSKQGAEVLDALRAVNPYRPPV